MEPQPTALFINETVTTVELMRTLLYTTQWYPQREYGVIPKYVYMVYYCPSCGAKQEDGHILGCKLAEGLAKVENLLKRVAKLERVAELVPTALSREYPSCTPERCDDGQGNGFPCHQRDGAIDVFRGGKYPSCPVQPLLIAMADLNLELKEGPNEC